MRKAGAGLFMGEGVEYWQSGMAGEVRNGVPLRRPVHLDEGVCDFHAVAARDFGWTLNGSFDVLAGMRFKFLGLEIADVGGSFLHVPDLCGSHKRSPDGINPPGPGTPDGGWLMTMDANGDVSHAARTAAALGMRWNGVTAAPDGTIYTAGNLDITILSGVPTLQIGKYDPSLNLLGMVTVGEATPTPSIANPSTNMTETPDHATRASITTDGDPFHPGRRGND